MLALRHQLGETTVWLSSAAGAVISGAGPWIMYGCIASSVFVVHSVLNLPLLLPMSSQSLLHCGSSAMMGNSPNVSCKRPVAAMNVKSARSVFFVANSFVSLDNWRRYTSRTHWSVGTGTGIVERHAGTTGEVREMLSLPFGVT